MRLAPAALLATVLAAPAAASAGELSITPYVWIPGITGTVGTAGGDTGLGSRLSVDLNRFSDSLRLGGAMLNMTWRQDRAVVFGDWTYANVRSSADTVVGIVYPTIEAQIKGNVLQFFSGYTVMEEGNASLSLFVGARAYDLFAGITYTGATVADVKGESSSFWMDAVAGLRLDAHFAEKWLLHLRGDLGSGGSSFTWQGYAVGGYAFKWGDLVGGYRHLYIDRGEGNVRIQLALSGPFVGAHFTF